MNTDIGKGCVLFPLPPNRPDYSGQWKQQRMTKIWQVSVKIFRLSIAIPKKAVGIFPSNTWLSLLSPA